VRPKFAPLIVTEVPTGPLLGLRRVILGDVTVNVRALLATIPPPITTTGPVVATVGTDAMMVV